MNIKREQRFIYLFRHGQTYFNRDHIFTGWKNSGLTALGKKEARLIARKLRHKKIDVAFHTRLLRTKQSLSEVLKFHPECKTIICDDRMIERGYGTLEGLHHDVIIKKYGSLQFEKWHRGFSERPPGGESFKDVEKRVGIFIKDLQRLIKQRKVNVVISAHGNSIRLFRKIMEGASVTQCVKWTIPYDKVFVYAISV